MVCILARYIQAKIPTAIINIHVCYAPEGYQKDTGPIFYRYFYSGDVTVLNKIHQCSVTQQLNTFFQEISLDHLL